jgi:sirohydrochlorin cobaltochelatase
MSTAPRTALVLAGHGSHISPQTAGIIWQYVDALRSLGAADEITAAFWKELPSFHTVLRTLTADDITIVPVFMANGYFTQTVIPAEMGLAGEITQRDSRLIRYAPPIGTHPRIRAIVRERVASTLRQINAAPSDVAIALIGHSTHRNPNSRLTTLAQANFLREIYPEAQIEAIFLDDDPEIPLIYELTDRPIIIAVPYFLAAGSHTTIDVPGELGLAPGQTSGEIRGRRVYYTPPPGTGDELIDIILETARQTSAPLPEPRPASAWEHFPSAGRDEFISEVHQRGEICLGELHITPTAIRPIGDSDGIEINDAAALRAIARENPFRPLAAPLKPGWTLPVNSPEMLHAAVETIYTGAIAAWAANKQGNLHPVSLEETVKRQTGMYRLLRNLDESQKFDMYANVCSSCARIPTWTSHTLNEHDIPCIEPCNWWLSAALETIKA